MRFPSGPRHSPSFVYCTAFHFVYSLFLFAILLLFCFSYVLLCVCVFVIFLCIYFSVYVFSIFSVSFSIDLYLNSLFLPLSLLFAQGSSQGDVSEEFIGRVTFT